MSRSRPGYASDCLSRRQPDNDRRRDRPYRAGDQLDGTSFGLRQGLRRTTGRPRKILVDLRKSFEVRRKSRSPGRTTRYSRTCVQEIRTDRPTAAICARGLTASAAVAAFLAFVFCPGLALGGIDAIRRAALAAFGVDAGLALLDREISLHRLTHQALGLFTHRLFRHRNHLSARSEKIGNAPGTMPDPRLCRI